jgi:hypothetical protein
VSFLIAVHCRFSMLSCHFTNTANLFHDCASNQNAVLAGVQVYVDVTAKSGLARASFVFNRQQVRQAAKASPRMVNV